MCSLFVGCNSMYSEWMCGIVRMVNSEKYKGKLRVR